MQLAPLWQTTRHTLRYASARNDALIPKSQMPSQKSQSSAKRLHPGKRGLARARHAPHVVCKGSQIHYDNYVRNYSLRIIDDDKGDLVLTIQHRQKTSRSRQRANRYAQRSCASETVVFQHPSQHPPLSTIRDAVVISVLELFHT